MASLGKPMTGPRANTDTLGTGEALNYKNELFFAFSGLNFSLFNSQMRDFELQIISEIISSLILESEGDRPFCSQSVHESWPDGPHIRGNDIKKKEISFTKIKSDCAEVLEMDLFVGCICKTHGKKWGKWMRNSKEEGELPGCSLQHRRSLTNRFPKGRGGWGKYKNEVKCYFLYSLPSSLSLKVQDSGQGGVFI